MFFYSTEAGMRFKRFSITVVLLAVCMWGSGFGESRDFHYRMNVRIEPALHQLEAEVWIKNPHASRYLLSPRNMPVRK